MIVKLSQSVADTLLEKALQAAPDEACGLLLGKVCGATLHIQQCVLSSNVTDGDPRTGFEIDPTLHLRLQKAARGGGEAIIGVWHSHPTSAARPSQEDARRSLEKGWLWLITGLKGDDWHTAAFLAGEIDPKVFERLSIQTHQ